ncbi:MAG: hypothetical protein M3401_14070 [Actinomycetota bacterium]|nr:hypothetical protein [Actinomycetota bacterium]
MDTAGSATAAGLPLACTLSADDGKARMRRWQALAEVGHPSVRRSGHRLEVRYEPQPGVRDELEALAAAERQCCSFVGWEVSQDGRHPILHVTADPSAPDDVAPIAVLFGAT